MNKNKKIVGVVVGILVLIGAFFGGMQYEKGRVSAAQLGNGMFARGTGGFGGMRGGTGANGAGMNGGFTIGSIVANDSSSITVRMQNGSTKIALMSSSTQIIKTASGTLSDLSVGANVSVMGSANSDGSMTAQSIQIRPAGTGTGMYRGPMPAGQANQ